MIADKSFILAPLRGLTGKEFRQALCQNFIGVSACVMPFFSVTDNILYKFQKYSGSFTDDELKHKCNYIIIPQIIGKNPEAIAGFCNTLCDNGFTHINFNLGCPMPQITKKKRGSGLLPYPDIIRQILDKVFSVDNLHFSVKVRLGFKSKEDIFKIVSVLNDYPIESVIVHPRLATDRYEGVVDLDTFDKLIGVIKHKLVYNGDIVDNKSFNMICNRFPMINTYMIGRGLLMKPFLAEELLQGKNMSYEDRVERFERFYADLLCLMKQKKNYNSHIKAYWKFFKCIYIDGEERYNKIVHEM